MAKFLVVETEVGKPSWSKKNLTIWEEAPIYAQTFEEAYHKMAEFVARDLDLEIVGLSADDLRLLAKEDLMRSSQVREFEVSLEEDLREDVKMGWERYF